MQSMSDERWFILLSKDTTSIKSISSHQQCYIIFRAFEPRVPELPCSDSDCPQQAHFWGTPCSSGKSTWSENSVEGCAIFLPWKLPKLWPKTRQKLLDEAKDFAILLGKPWYLGYPIFTASSLDGCGCWGFSHFVFHDEICTCCSNQSTNLNTGFPIFWKRSWGSEFNVFLKKSGRKAFYTLFYPKI